MGHHAGPQLVPVCEWLSAYAGNRQVRGAKMGPQQDLTCTTISAAFSATTSEEAEVCCLLRQPANLITTGTSRTHWRHQEGGKIPDKTERGPAQPCLTHPTLRTGNVVSVALWTAQMGNSTADGRDRQGLGSTARRVTENSPSAFVKQMLSSYSLCTEKQGETAVRQFPSCRYCSSTHEHPPPSPL